MVRTRFSFTRQMPPRLSTAIAITFFVRGGVPSGYGFITHHSNVNSVIKAIGQAARGSRWSLAVIGVEWYLPLCVTDAKVQLGTGKHIGSSTGKKYEGAFSPPSHSVIIIRG